MKCRKQQRMLQKFKEWFFGRVDFTSSGVPRSDINTQKISEYDEVAKSKECGLDLVVGGGVAIEAIDLLKEIKNIHLSRFETRKVVFSSDALDNPNMDKGLETQTVILELLQVENKGINFTKNYK